MTRKKSTRSAESYTGNTEQAKINQRRNLIPGNAFNKRWIREMKLDCWWEDGDLPSKQFIYEGCEKGRDIDKVPKDELTDEIEMYSWWRSLDIKNKKSIYDLMMIELSGGQKAQILANIEECVKEKLEVEKVRR